MPAPLFARLARRTTPKGRRIRLPLSLTYSPHHSPLSVAAYGIVEVLGSPDPFEASNEWLAGRLDCSPGGIAKALGALCTTHTGTGTTPDLPRFMTSKRRGRGRTAERFAVPAAEGDWVDVPEWTLGDDTSGPLVKHLAWRLYVIVLAKRAPGRPWCSLKRSELADLLRVRGDSIPALLRALEAAGMIAVAARPGLPSLIMPLMVQLDAAVLVQLPAAMLDACAQPVDRRTAAPLADDDAPHPSTGQTPHPSTGKTPHPSTGQTNKRPDLSSPDLEDPGSATARSTASRRAVTPDGDVITMAVAAHDLAQQRMVAAATAAASTVIADARAQIAAATRRYRDAAGESRTGGFAALVAATMDTPTRPLEAAA